MSFSHKLLKWFDQFGRHDLPWQPDPTPYKVWLSEIMLQQTQVTTVISYYLRFLDEFPDIKTLAAAPLDKVLALWAGLGYYARARNLHKTAKLIMNQHQGIFPSDFDSLIALPGIGRSTAGAILAFTTGQRYPILDGNVRRVLSRYFAVKGVVSTRAVQENLWALSDHCTPKKRVHHYTQAIMDMGATLCTRSKPKCTLCPVASSCQALQENQVHAYPERAVKAEKPVRSTQMLLLVDTKLKKILLEKRPTEGIWGGMWSLPECESSANLRQQIKSSFASIIAEVKKIEIWKAFRHTFTHYHLDIHARLITVSSKIHPNPKKLSSYQWVQVDKALQLGLPAPVKRLLVTVRALS
jgi:A/G-specific adenine glycosylase